MQLLILSCNTGEGHNSAAKAIKEYCELRGDCCDIKDALAYLSEEASKLISKGHIFVYRRLPRLFGVGYRFEEKHPPKEGDNSLMYEIVKRGIKSLNDALCESKYDAVICTHVFSAMMMTELRLRNLVRIPTYFVATDYTCSPGVAETLLDGYFIPHSALCEEFSQNGIERELLVPTGLPVKPAFYEKINRKEAKCKLKLPDDRRMVLLMCGSMGCGPIKELCATLPNRLPDDAHLAVICGNNRHLYNSLTKNGIPHNVTIVGYTTRISLYMDASAVLLTKPGGLSSTEAAVKHIPMVFINAVPGCETRNLDFFISNGLAVSGEDVDELCDMVCMLLKKPSIADNMVARLKDNFSFCASEQIFKYIHEGAIK